jgi:hypothetical protein
MLGRAESNEEVGREVEWPLASCPTCRGIVVPVHCEWMEYSQEETEKRNAAAREARKARKRAKRQTEEGKKKEKERRKNRKNRNKGQDSGLVADLGTSGSG